MMRQGFYNLRFYSIKNILSNINICINIFIYSTQELSPTGDTNIVKACMNLMDCLMDEFHDEEIVKGLNEREIASWIEVYIQNIIYNCKKNYKDVLINDELFDVVKKDQKFFQVFFKCLLLQFTTTVE